MATSSIKKNFVVSGKEQAEIFANAIEESYQESLNRKPISSSKAILLEDSDEIINLLKKGKFINA